MGRRNGTLAPETASNGAVTQANPFQTLADRLRHATPTALALSARACLHRAGAAFEATGRLHEAAPVFGQHTLTDIGIHTPLPQLLTPVFAAQPLLRHYAADPETGDLPTADKSATALMLSMVTELTLQADPSAHHTPALLHDWAQACSDITLTMCLHIDTKDTGHFPTPESDPGRVASAELATQLSILHLLAIGTEDAYYEAARLSQAQRAEFAVAISGLITG